MLVQGGLVKDPRRIGPTRLLNHASQSFGESPSVSLLLSDPVAGFDECCHRKHEPLTLLATVLELVNYFAGLLLAVQANEADDYRRVDEDNLRKTHQLLEAEHIGERSRLLVRVLGWT